MGTSATALPAHRALSIALWVVFCIALLSVVSIGAYYWVPAAEQFSITERYLFTSTGNDVRVYLGVLLPRTGPYQQVSPARVYWQGSVNREYERNVDILKLSTALQNASSQEAIIEYDVTLRLGNTTWEAPIERFQIIPQHNIESDHPILVQAARQIASNHTRQDAYQIYSFTSQTLNRAQQERKFIDASALKAYETREGSCGEFANLMVALCRAAGIPAQTIIGVLFPDLPPYSTAAIRSLSHPGESHAWVEFNADSRWTLADPSCQMNSLTTTGFGRNDGRHLSYGETQQLTEAYATAREWAVSHGSLIGTQFASLKFIAAADGEEVIVTPRVTMRKGWDGRWGNLLVCWFITLVFLCQANRRRLAACFPARTTEIQFLQPVATPMPLPSPGGNGAARSSADQIEVDTIVS